MSIGRKPKAYASLLCKNSWHGIAQWIVHRYFSNSIQDDSAPSEIAPQNTAQDESAPSQIAPRIAQDGSAPSEIILHNSTQDKSAPSEITPLISSHNHEL
jgi:hypothetical protein